MKGHPGKRELLLLAIVAIAAVVIHGYHPAIEDAEIYVPAIKKALNPSLYPHNDVFFMSHARMTLFPRLIATSVRLSHFSLDWILLLWQLFSIFLLLLACWHVGRLAFGEPLARWGGIALAASLLTLPVAGTALYVMDEYINPRSLSTPAVLFIIINVVERRFARGFLWMLLTAVVHPLMVVFGAAYGVIYLLTASWQRHAWQAQERVEIQVAAFLPLGLFPAVTEAYRQALNDRPYFFLLRWHWYEWLGIFGPFALFVWWRSIARRMKQPVFEHLCTTSVIFGAAFFVVALVITIPTRFTNLVELQPMRSLHLLYVIWIVLGGGLLAQFVLKTRLWRWALLLVPLCAGMALVQRETFSSTAHLELPWTKSQNKWVEAFDWIRQNTPANAYFALDPKTMSLPGEDQHGFRAIAERSMLADDVKDTGAVTMFPAMAASWQEQVRAQAGWREFQAANFRALQKRFGIDWIVVQGAGIVGFHCPYSNATLTVCRVD